MWTILESWQLGQLQRLAATDSERVEEVLNTLWQQYPGLLGELAVAAVDQEQLSIDRCAELLQISPEEVEQRLLAFRQRNVKLEKAVVVDDNNRIARLAEGQVAVWEVVREYRKLGSVERLTESFPGIAKSELAAALMYADRNPAEIETLICRYEEYLQKRRAEYPFAR